MTFDDIVPAWADQIAAGGARQRRIDNHPLPLYYGSNEVSKPIFFLLTEVEPHFPRLANAISVEKGLREDGRWTIVLTLEEKSLAEAFMGMCVELARRSASAGNAPTARTIFFETLHNWKTLLAGATPRRMSEREIRGLLAELWFGMERLGPLVELGAVVLAWQGPYGAPQDFLLSDGAMYEVKCVHAGSRTVEISSADQLDPPDNGPLVLSLVSMEQVPSGTTLAHSLQSLVDEFRRRLSGDPLMLEEFDHRLDALQVDIADEHYREHHYAISGCRDYAVTDGFPRMLRKDVPIAVDRLNYRLRIAGLEEFEFELEAASKA